MTRLMREGNWARPVFARLFNVFSAIALLLAAVGVSGSTSYSEAQRRREFGIRTALGATPTHVARLVLRRVGHLTLAGLGAGLPVAFLGVRFIAHFLFGVSPRDPLVYAGAAAGVAAVALLACYLPTRRATRVDVVPLLRVE
jgi:putative ABC transport system permease protein